MQNHAWETALAVMKVAQWRSYLFKSYTIIRRAFILQKHVIVRKRNERKEHPIQMWEKFAENLKFIMKQGVKYNNFVKRKLNELKPLWVNDQVRDSNVIILLSSTDLITWKITRDEISLTVNIKKESRKWEIMLNARHKLIFLIPFI